MEILKRRKIQYSTQSVSDWWSPRNDSDMGDINFPDLGDFLSVEGSQILARSSGDNGLIEKQMSLPTFPVNYTWRLYIILSHTGTGSPHAPKEKTGWGRNLKTGFLGLLWR